MDVLVMLATISVSMSILWVVDFLLKPKKINQLISSEKTSFTFLYTLNAEQYKMYLEKMRNGKNAGDNYFSDYFSSLFENFGEINVVRCSERSVFVTKT